MIRRTLTLLPAVAAGLLAAPLSAQDASAPFGETIDVEVVNLEVYVTDRKGRPVTGLGRGDFELFADGERVPVTNFYAVEDGRRIAGEEVTVTGGPAPAAPAEGAEPVFLVVFLDNVHLGQFSRNRVLEELRSFVRERVREGDQVMLATFDGRVQLRQAFTSDWEALDRMLDVLAIEPGFGHLREQEHRRLLDDLMVLSDVSRYNRARGVPKTKCPVEMGEMARRYAEEVYGRVHASVASLGDFVDSLASLPGRKALLHVSDGLPFNPGAEVFEFLFQYCGQAGAESLEYDAEAADGQIPEETSGRFEQLGLSTDADPSQLGDAYQAQEATLDATRFHTAELFDELTDRANAQRVTLFALEAYGPRNFSRSDASVGRRDTTSRRADEVRRASLQDSLSTMAERTGGRAILDTTAFAPALERIAGDLDGYYSLGYRLPRTAEGRDVKVKVEVRRPGVTVRHRKSLRARSLAEELAGRTRAALVFGLADNPLAIAVGVGRILPMDDGLHLVPVRLSIPLGKIALLPEAADYRGQLTLYVTGRDREGRMSPVRTVAIPLRIPADQVAVARDKVMLYEVKMLMRQGDHTVAVGVHDDLASIGSFVTEDVMILARHNG